MARALEGITVLDFSHVVAGPLATHFLALNGARVIKIEKASGDPLRNYTPDPSEYGMSPAFAGINVGKESLVLDLKTDEGRTEALRLAAEADIVVENFRPGVMARLGLGFDTLKEVNPRLIYCAVSGFGQTGAMKNVAAIDQIVQSLSGLMYLTGHEGDPATRVGFPIIDTFTGLLAAFAIQTALVQRERGNNEGQMIDVAMMDATLVMLLSVVNPLLIAGQTPVRSGNRGFSQAPTADTFACLEGEITVGAVEQGHVEKMLAVMGFSELLDDPKFSDRLARSKNADAMRELLAGVFLKHSATEWEEKLQRAGVPAARVLDVASAIDLPMLAQRNLFLDVGGTRVLNAGYQFQNGGPGIDRPAPALGEHTQSINQKPIPNKRA